MICDKSIKFFILGSMEDRAGTELLELIASLTDVERKEFEHSITSHKRKSLSSLYSCLLQNAHRKNKEGIPIPPSKSDLYQSAFGSKYKKAKDLLLRNELRLLNEELQKYLIHIKFRKEIESNLHNYHLWALKVLDERALKHQLEIKYKQFVKLAKDEMQTKYVKEMYEIHRKYNLGTGNVSEINESEALAFAKENILWIIKDFVRELRIAEVIKAHAEGIIHQNKASQKFSELLSNIDINSGEFNDAYSDYHKLFALSYSLTADKQIEIFHEALKLIELCEYPGLMANEKKFILLSSIALAYSQLCCFKDADGYYEKAIEHAKACDIQIELRVLFNFVSNKTKLENYSGALQLMKEYEEKIMRSNDIVRQRFMYLKGACFIFLNEPLRALDCIPDDIHHLFWTTRIAFYYLHSIIIYQTDDWEDNFGESESKRKCVNLKRDLRYAHKQKLDIDYKTLTEIFISFYGCMKHSINRRTKELKQIQKRIEDFESTLNCVNKLFLMLVWLKIEVRKQISICTSRKRLESR